MFLVDFNGIKPLLMLLRFFDIFLCPMSVYPDQYFSNWFKKKCGLSALQFQLPVCAQQNMHKLFLLSISRISDVLTVLLEVVLLLKLKPLKTQLTFLCGGQSGRCWLNFRPVVVVFLYFFFPLFFPLFYINYSHCKYISLSSPLTVI